MTVILNRRQLNLIRRALQMYSYRGPDNLADEVSYLVSEFIEIEEQETYHSVPIDLSKEGRE